MAAISGISSGGGGERLRIIAPQPSGPQVDKADAPAVTPPVRTEGTSLPSPDIHNGNATIRIRRSMMEIPLKQAQQAIMQQFQANQKVD